MALVPKEAPKFLVLEPRGGLRLELRLPTSACLIDVALERPSDSRSFVLMIGPPGAPYVQRARVAGRAQLLYEPGQPGVYALLITNPMREPAVVRLRLRAVADRSRAVRRSASRSRARARRAR